MKSQQAIKILLGILTAVLLFHLCIVFRIIPYEITWGGRLKSDQEMYVFESMSIAINLLFMLVLAIRGNYIKAIIPPKGVHIVLWILFGLFCLNTVGNLFAKTNFERYLTILTLATVWLLWVILRKRKP